MIIQNSAVSYIPKQGNSAQKNYLAEGTETASANEISTQKFTPSTSVVCASLGIIEAKNVSRIHSAEIVEATKSTTYVDGTKNTKSIYKEPEKILGMDFYTAYFGINFVQKGQVS